MWQDLCLHNQFVKDIRRNFILFSFQGFVMNNKQKGIIGTKIRHHEFEFAIFEFPIKRFYY